VAGDLDENYKVDAVDEQDDINDGDDINVDTANDGD
jgi:hypothetical protein